MAPCQLGVLPGLSPLSLTLPARPPLRLPAFTGDCDALSLLTHLPGLCRKSTWFIIDEEGHKSILHADKRNIISVGGSCCDCLAGLQGTSRQACALGRCFCQPTASEEQAAWWRNG